MDTSRCSTGDTRDLAGSGLGNRDAVATGRAIGDAGDGRRDVCGSQEGQLPGAMDGGSMSKSSEPAEALVRHGACALLWRASPAARRATGCGSRGHYHRRHPL
jgi:hypothetical protein